MAVDMYDIDGDKMTELYRMALADRPLSEVLKVIKNDNEKAFYVSIKKTIAEMKADGKKKGKKVDFYIPE